MRKIQLYDSDAAMYDKEIMPQDFEFFQKHKDAFKRMWHDQGKEFWVRFVMTFRSFSVKYGIIKEFQLKQENYEAIIDYAFIYIHEQYVDGKLGTARELVLDIVVTAQYRHLLQHLESKSMAKDPFYNKDTRDVFRRLFGQPGEKATHLKVLLILPLYLKYGGAVCQCLRRWLEAPSMKPNDDSYWVAPSKTKEDSIDHLFSLFMQERLNGDPLGPRFVVFWPYNLADPRKIDKNNPLFNPNDTSADWREHLTCDKYKEFVHYCESKYNSQTLNKKKANKVRTSQEKETIAPPETSLAGKRKKNKKKKKKCPSGNGDIEDLNKDGQVEAHYQFRVKIEEEKEEVTTISMESDEKRHAVSLLDISKKVLERTVADITTILGDGGEDSENDEEDNMYWYNASHHAMLNIHMANMLNDEKERHAARNEKRNPRTEANGPPVTITERKRTFDQILKRPSGSPAPNTNILKMFRRADEEPWKGVMSRKDVCGKKYCPNPLHFELTMRYFGENREITYCVCGQRTRKSYLDESERSANYNDLTCMQEYRLESVMARMKKRGIWGKPRENIREETTFHYEKDPAADSNKKESPPAHKSPLKTGNMENEKQILSTLLGRGTPEQKMEMVKAQLQGKRQFDQPEESGGAAEAAKPSGLDTDMLRVEPGRGSNHWKERMASVEIDGEYYCPNPVHYELTQKYFGLDSDRVKREITYCICGQKVRPDLIDENERLGDFKSLTATQKAEFMAIQARGGRRAPLLNDDAIKAKSLRNAAKIRTAGSNEQEGDFTREDAEALSSVFDDLGFDNDVKKSLFKALPATKDFRIDMKGDVVSVQSDDKLNPELSNTTPALDPTQYVEGQEYKNTYSEVATPPPKDMTRDCLLEAMSAHVKDLWHIGDLPAGLSPRIDQKKRTQAMKDRLRQKQMLKHMDMELDAQLGGFLDMEPPPPPSLPLPAHDPFNYPPLLPPSSPVKIKSMDSNIKQDKSPVKAVDQMQNGSPKDTAKSDKQERGTRIDPVHGSSVDPFPHSPEKDSNKSKEEKHIPPKSTHIPDMRKSWGVAVHKDKDGKTVQKDLPSVEYDAADPNRKSLLPDTSKINPVDYGFKPNDKLTYVSLGRMRVSLTEPHIQFLPPLPSSWETLDDLEQRRKNMMTKPEMKNSKSGEKKAGGSSPKKEHGSGSDSGLKKDTAKHQSKGKGVNGEVEEIVTAGATKLGEPTTTPTLKLWSPKTEPVPDQPAPVSTSVEPKENPSPDKEQKKLRPCTNCKTVEPRPKAYKKCQKCKEVGAKSPRFYCSRDCQVADWKACHQKEHKENALD